MQPQSDRHFSIAIGLIAIGLLSTVVPAYIR